MWCANCQSEVAAEATPETGQVRCASCGNELSSGTFARLDQNLRQAKELLDRWSREPMLEPYGTLPGSRTAVQAEAEQIPLLHEQPSESPSAEPQFRLDQAHRPTDEAAPEIAEPAPDKTASEPAPQRNRGVQPLPDPFSALEFPIPREPVMEETQVQSPPPAAQRQSRIESEHPAARSSQPHFDVQKLIEDKQNGKRPARANGLMMTAGQWLSYLGVLGLTAGASMVVYGYFGGEAGLTPKGWMLTTAGQMLLFLGIVTLISSGMDQASDEMGRKIEILGEQMLRFEQHTREQFLRGPKIPPEAYGDDPRTSNDSRERDVSEITPVQ